MGLGLINPTMENVLRTFKLDITYNKAEGLHLYDEDGNCYLDFIAQYGAVPFGYNPPEIVNAITEFLESGIPTMVQPSVPLKAVELAERLIEVAPGRMAHVSFCQSGAEAVETSIKLARSATGRHKIISAINSFHGKTMGALSATGRQVYQKPFFVPVPGFETVAFNDLNALEDIFSKEGDNIAAFIVEPIQGEGGIIISSQGYLKQVGELCKKYGILLIVDEIQTGLGRTGSLFACDKEGVEPDILLLSKALGGGMVPIGACLCTKEVWNQQFGELHSSTFANNNLTCSVGLAVLNKLMENNSAIVQNAATKGNYIIDDLYRISQKYPGVIKDIRGRGLMIGVEFNQMDGSESFSMKYLCEQGGFNGLLAGFLLRSQKVRFAPFLNNPMTLRVQPSLNVGSREVETALSSIEYITEILYYGDYNKLFSYIIDRKFYTPVKDYRNSIKPVVSSKLKPGEKPTESFAFIIHYPSTDEMKKTNISFEEMTASELSKILDWEAASDVDPQVLVHMPAIRSKAGKIAEGWLIGIPYSGKHLLELPRKEAVEQVGKAVDLAKELGAKMVGLGAYTSVVTRGGADLQGRGAAITSGNSYTIVTAYDALIKGAHLMDIDIERATGSVIGATGSIGRVSALLLANEVRQLLLVGNPQKGQASLRRLERLAEEIYSQAFSKVLASPDGVGLRGISKWLYGFINHLKLKPEKLKTLGKGYENGKKFYFTGFIKENLAENDIYSRPPVVITLNINNAVAASDLIISASSSTSNLIGPEHIKPGSVICDVARPADVSKAVLENRKDVLVIEGGLVSYPDNICFGQNIGYGPGTNLACLSETILLALEGDYRDYSIGSKISMEEVGYLRFLADKHGFKLALPRNEIGEITPTEIKAIKEALSIKLRSFLDREISLVAAPSK